jgi:hypothetical protein
MSWLVTPVVEAISLFRWRSSSRASFRALFSSSSRLYAHFGTSHPAMMTMMTTPAVPAFASRVTKAESKPAAPSVRQRSGQEGVFCPPPVSHRGVSWAGRKFCGGLPDTFTTMTALAPVPRRALMVPVRCGAAFSWTRRPIRHVC